MDSGHSGDKSRKKNNRVLPEFNNYELPSRNPEGKSADFDGISSRLSSKKFSPDPELPTRHRTVGSEGVTVDELKKYGRRRQPSHLRPQDNLRLEEGSLKLYKSEYKRRYLAHGFPNFPQLREETKKPTDEDFRRILRKPRNNLLLPKNHPMESLTEKNSKYVAYPHYERRKLLRRSTALRPEGEMASETEVRKEYVGYPNPEKALIIRKLPSLKLEGEFEPLTTEQREKYIAYLSRRPRIFEKKKTSLKMEGDFDFLTEKSLSYIPHEFSERPRIRKRSTSLKLDGEVEFFPEYRNSFVDFPRTRPITYKPDGHMRQEPGEFEDRTETKAQFVNFENVPIPQSAKPENNLHVEGEMEISPEYRINFVDFPRERPFLRRPLNQLKPEGNLQILTESSERFSDVGGVEKSENLQRPNNLTPNGEFNLSENAEKFKKHELPDKTQIPKLSSNLKLEGEIDFTTEKAEKFRPPTQERGATARRSSNLKLEGEFLFLPEYKRAYVDFGKNKNLLSTKNPKSNPTSPRKTPKDKLKLVPEDKRSNLGTPRKKSNAKRLKETTPEKILQFEVPADSLNRLEDRRRFNYQPPLPQISPPHASLLTPPKEFSAFQVLDVKGQIGCQSMMNGSLGSEKSTSDEESNTYRLEVSNAGEKSPDFYGRALPSLAVNPDDVKEAEKRARQRAENFVKVVKSPEIPNYLLEESSRGVENRWKVPEKLCPLSPQEDLSKRAFVVLD